MFKSSYLMSSSFSIALCRMSSWCITDLDHQMPIMGGTSNCNLPSQLHSKKWKSPTDLMLYCSWSPDASTVGSAMTVHSILNCILQNFKMTLHRTALGHQMPLPGGWHSLSTAFSIAFFRMSSWPCVVLLLATRCLYQGGTSDQDISECHLAPQLNSWKFNMKFI